MLTGAPAQRNLNTEATSTSQHLFYVSRGPIEGGQAPDGPWCWCGHTFLSLSSRNEATIRQIPDSMQKWAQILSAIHPPSSTPRAGCGCLWNCDGRGGDARVLTLDTHVAFSVAERNSIGNVGHSPGP